MKNAASQAFVQTVILGFWHCFCVLVVICMYYFEDVRHCKAGSVSRSMDQLHPYWLSRRRRSCWSITAICREHYRSCRALGDVTVITSCKLRRCVRLAYTSSVCYANLLVYVLINSCSPEVIMITVPVCRIQRRSNWKRRMWWKMRVYQSCILNLLAVLGKSKSRFDLNRYWITYGYLISVVKYLIWTYTIRLGFDLKFTTIRFEKVPNRKSKNIISLLPP